MLLHVKGAGLQGEAQRGGEARVVADRAAHDGHDRLHDGVGVALFQLVQGSVVALDPVTLKSLADNSAMAETSNNNDVDDYYRLN